jgi:hypothetical protein
LTSKQDDAAQADNNLGQHQKDGEEEQRHQEKKS